MKKYTNEFIIFGKVWIGTLIVLAMVEGDKLNGFDLLFWSFFAAFILSSIYELGKAEGRKEVGNY